MADREPALPHQPLGLHAIRSRAEARAQAGVVERAQPGEPLVESTITRASLRMPPHTPEPPPKGTTGTRASRQSASTRETSCVLSGSTTARGGAGGRPSSTSSSESTQASRL